MFFEVEMILRLSISIILGAFIGFERKLRNKEAGMKTHSIVGVGACLMMLISKYGFEGQTADGSRIAAQVVSGIGFLGAGIIMFKGESLKGLTTAAGIWSTAGVGMAIGAGMYVIGVSCSFFIVFIQFILHLNIKLFKSKEFHIIRAEYFQNDGQTQKIKDYFNIKKFMNIELKKEDNNIICKVEFRTFGLISADSLEQIMLKDENIKVLKRMEDEA